MKCEGDPHDFSVPCLTCRALKGFQSQLTPCIRHKVSGIRLIEPDYIRGYNWTDRWNKIVTTPIQVWAAGETKPVSVSNGFGGEYFTIRVRQFTTERHALEPASDLVDANSAPLATDLALADLEAAETAYANYISRIMDEVLPHFSGPPSGLLHEAYRQACRMLEDPGAQQGLSEMLNATLRVWAAVRLLTTPLYIICEDTLEKENEHSSSDRSPPSVGMILAPPVLKEQLELVLIHHIQETLGKELLCGLQGLLYKNRKDTWLVMYLVTLILLQNTARLTTLALSYIGTSEKKVRYVNHLRLRKGFLANHIAALCRRKC